MDRENKTSGLKRGIIKEKEVKGEFKEEIKIEIKEKVIYKERGDEREGKVKGW